MSAKREGKILWHMTEGPPSGMGEWSDLVYPGRPHPPNGRNRWRDGTDQHAPWPKDPKAKLELPPIDPERKARIEAMLLANAEKPARRRRPNVPEPDESGEVAKHWTDEDDHD